MPLRLRYVAIRFAIRPSPRNAERFDRSRSSTSTPPVDATLRWYAAFDAYTRARAPEPHVKKTMRHLIATADQADPDSELARIDIPTTLLWGRHDRMVPLAIGETARSRHRWPLQVIDDAAHAPHIEQPDTFVETLTAMMSVSELQRPSARERNRRDVFRTLRPDCSKSSTKSDRADELPVSNHKEARPPGHTLCRVNCLGGEE